MNSNKIKKITLDCFRAFSKKQVLDFGKGENVADIIVIYAPNGTGKTSVIEGVEWATTGKISRIEKIFNTNSPRQRNPKEGCILKNRQSISSIAKVSIEIDNGKYISRNTKPKSNRNNDYCSGILDATFEKYDTFGTNILSQGNINRFSYEASNGILFKSLISSKDSSDDISLFDKLKSLKIKFETSNSEKKTEIALLKTLIKDEQNKIIELKNTSIKIQNIENTDELKLFRDEFPIYQDCADKNIDEEITYVNQTSASLQFIKEKIIDFDITSYRNALIRIGLLKKAINLKSEISKTQHTLDNNIKVIRDTEIQLNKLYPFLSDSGLLHFNSIIDDYKSFTELINKNQHAYSRHQHLHNSTLIKISKLDNNINTVKRTEHLLFETEKTLTSLFHGMYVEDFVFENEAYHIKNIDDELAMLNNQLALLSKDSYIFLNAQTKEVKELNAKLLELESINIKLSKITSEKLKLKTVEEKIGLIKSSIIDIVTENNLDNCPSCGTKFDNMASLLYSINGVGSSAINIFDSVFKDYNAQKSNLSIELEKTNNLIDTIISKKKSHLNQKIQSVAEKKEHTIHLFTLLSSLGIEFYQIGINDILEDLKNRKSIVSYNLIKISKKKEKYGKLLNIINIRLNDINSEIYGSNIKLKNLENSCNDRFGMSLNDSYYKFSHGHVSLFEQKKLVELKESLFALSAISEDTLIKLQNSLFLLNRQGDFSENYDLAQALDISIRNKKNIRSNYNYIKENIKSFNIRHALNYIDLIVKLEGLFFTRNKSLIAEKELLEKTNSLVEYEKQLISKNEELTSGLKSIILLNKSLDDSLIYFSDLASNSINNDILNDMFMYVEPHLKYDKIKFKVDLSGGNKGIYIQAHSSENNESTTPVYYLSEAQINILSICIFLADHAKKIEGGINTIIIDDPVQSMDDLNSYALIDLCKLFTRRFEKQIIITTHNRGFFNLFKEKLPESRYGTKFINL